MESFNSQDTILEAISFARYGPADINYRPARTIQTSVRNALIAGESAGSCTTQSLIALRKRIVAAASDAPEPVPNVVQKIFRRVCRTLQRPEDLRTSRPAILSRWKRADRACRKAINLAASRLGSLRMYRRSDYGAKVVSIIDGNGSDEETIPIEAFLYVAASIERRAGAIEALVDLGSMDALEDALKLWQWQDEVLEQHGSQGYSLAKTIEAVGHAEIIRREDGFTVTYDALKAKLEQRERALTSPENPRRGTSEAVERLFDIMASVRDIPASVVTKTIMSPIVNLPEAVRETREKCTRPVPIDPSMPVLVKAAIAREITVGYCRRHGKFPTFLSELTLEDRIRTGSLLLSRDDEPISSFLFAEFAPFLPTENLSNYVSTIADKSVSPGRKIVEDIISRRVNPGSIPHLRNALLHTLAGPYSHPHFQEWFEVSPCAHRPIAGGDEHSVLLRAKEDEEKPVPRMFGMLTPSLRAKQVIAQENIERLIRLYVPLSSHGLSLEESHERLVRMTTDDPSDPGVAMALDFTAWNSRFTPESMQPLRSLVSSVFGKDLGETLSDLNACEFRYLGVDGGAWGPSTERHTGGVEGINQAFMTLATFGLILVALEMAECERAVMLGHGDNQTVKVWPKDKAVHLESWAFDLATTIEKVAARFGHEVKADEFTISRSFLPYDREVYIRGSKHRRIGKIGSALRASSEEMMTSLDGAVSSIWSSAVKLADESSSPERAWAIAAIRMMDLLADGSARGHLLEKQIAALNIVSESDMAITLLLNQSLGGLPISTVPGFFVSGFPDPVTEGLVNLRYADDAGSLVARYLAVPLGPRQPTTVLIDDPTAIPVQAVSDARGDLTSRVIAYLGRSANPDFAALYSQGEGRGTQLRSILAESERFNPYVGQSMYDVTGTGTVKRVLGRIDRTGSLKRILADSELEYAIGEGDVNLSVARARLRRSLHEVRAIGSPSAYQGAVSLRSRWGADLDLASVTALHPWDELFGVKTGLTAVTTELRPRRRPGPAYRGNRINGKKPRMLFEGIHSVGMDDLVRVATIARSGLVGENLRNGVEAELASRGASLATIEAMEPLGLDDVDFGNALVMPRCIRQAGDVPAASTHVPLRVIAGSKDAAPPGSREAVLLALSVGAGPDVTMEGATPHVHADIMDSAPWPPPERDFSSNPLVSLATDLLRPIVTPWTVILTPLAEVKGANAFAGAVLQECLDPRRADGDRVGRLATLFRRVAHAGADAFGSVRDFLVKGVGPQGVTPLRQVQSLLAAFARTGVSQERAIDAARELAGVVSAFHPRHGTVYGLEEPAIIETEDVKSAMDLRAERALMALALQEMGSRLWVPRDDRIAVPGIDFPIPKAWRDVIEADESATPIRGTALDLVLRSSVPTFTAVNARSVHVRPTGTRGLVPFRCVGPAVAPINLVHRSRRDVEVIPLLLSACIPTLRVNMHPFAGLYLQALARHKMAIVGRGAVDLCSAMAVMGLPGLAILRDTPSLGPEAAIAVDTISGEVVEDHRIAGWALSAGCRGVIEAGDMAMPEIRTLTECTRRAQTFRALGVREYVSLTILDQEDLTSAANIDAAPGQRCRVWILSRREDHGHVLCLLRLRLAAGELMTGEGTNGGVALQGTKWDPATVPNDSRGSVALFVASRAGIDVGVDSEWSTVVGDVTRLVTRTLPGMPGPSALAGAALKSDDPLAYLATRAPGIVTAEMLDALSLVAFFVPHDEGSWLAPLVPTRPPAEDDGETEDAGPRPDPFQLSEDNITRAMTDRVWLAMQRLYTRLGRDRWLEDARHYAPFLTHRK